MKTGTNITYLVLLAGLLLQPHLIRGHILGLSEAVAESLGTLILLGAGYIAYWLHQRDLIRKEEELHKLENDLEISADKLSESYRYIGQVNRKLPLITHVTSDLLKQTPRSKKEKAQIIADLLSTASALAKTDWAMLRVVNTESGKTEKEFVGSGKQFALLQSHISNKALLACNGGTHKVHVVEDALVMRSSDTTSRLQSFLITPNTGKPASENVSLMQSITDQAQLFYAYLYVTLQKPLSATRNH